MVGYRVPTKGSTGSVMRMVNEVTPFGRSGFGITTGRDARVNLVTERVMDGASCVSLSLEGGRVSLGVSRMPCVDKYRAVVRPVD